MKYAKDFKELCRVNTGAHFLDSGGAYGRHWEKGPIPDNMPLEYATVWGTGAGSVRPLISTAVLLDMHFDIDQRQTDHFRRWAHLADKDDERSWLSLAEEYAERMAAKGKAGEGAERASFSGNAYNEDTDLDQVFQYTSPSLRADWHLIQTHNGCDVRGGYTAPVVARGDLEEVLCSMQLSFWCSPCDERANDIYQFEKDKWGIRVNKRSVTTICPKCKRSCERFPIIN